MGLCQFNLMQPLLWYVKMREMQRAEINRGEVRKNLVISDIISNFTNN